MPPTFGFHMSLFANHSVDGKKTVVLPPWHFPMKRSSHSHDSHEGPVGKLRRYQILERKRGPPFGSQCSATIPCDEILIDYIFFNFVQKLLPPRNVDLHQE